MSVRRVCGYPQRSELGNGSLAAGFMDGYELPIWVLTSEKSTFRHWAISLATLKFLKMICLIWTISYFIFFKNGEKWHKLNIINIWKSTFYFLIYTSFCANHHLILERVYYPVFPRHSLLLTILTFWDYFGCSEYSIYMHVAFWIAPPTLGIIIWVRFRVILDYT